MLGVKYLMSGVNETKFLVEHESCECKCELNESICNSKQKWNHNECSWECKELDNWSSCKDDYMWSFGTCDCECNKVKLMDEYLDIKNRSCEKRLIGKLVLECENEILNVTENSLNNTKVTCEKIIALFTQFH